jgi:hypothetical protein
VSVLGHKEHCKGGEEHDLSFFEWLRRGI